ncbi:Wadjet anti-phage system protein JetD domain-containing protein [Curtobacterium ammoniigenes]|uniref:Wadjet anti-phage system protein JetD domain-containing protein n=1 Tax=Curtobacterium ammoniigenes TaxID=395387 RepID=UPI0008297121|nr:Wadjet anti-phage system protein JetD domain-containing protein [Curtobacterium ammoniigenes]
MSGASPVDVEELRRRARRLFERDSRGWAATGQRDIILDAPLHPPTERAALSDLDHAQIWVATWRKAEASGDIALSWTTRHWPRVGSQAVPERAEVHGADAIARVAGAEDEWTVLRARLDQLRIGSGTHPSTELIAVLQAQARVIAALDATDFERLVQVLAWLGENPSSGLRLRELPIRGIHTKWIEVRRRLVESLHAAMTGNIGLGLREPSPLIRMRYLDPALQPGPLRDVTAPVEQLAALPLRTARIFVLENLTTMLALPDSRGAVVLDGGGRRVDLVARLPWAQEVIYWGDLDSHGFSILHQLRAHGVDATAALMDTETLLEHRDLWGTDSDPDTGVLPLLTPAEQATLRRLGAEGNVRLEQERIPWDYAIPRLGI